MRPWPLIAGVLFVALSWNLAAKPARKGLVSCRQPDGTVLEIRLYGDEFAHYATDAQGRLLEADALGVLRLSALPQPSLPRHGRRSMSSPRSISGRSSLRALVIPVEFEDLHFTIDDIGQQLEGLLDGRVKTYFQDNSGGLFTPVFDVSRPIRLTKSVSWYGSDVYQSGSRVGDKAPELALLEACQALDGELDFSRYDEDGDGTADLVIYFFAGHDQADGGPQETLWSHAWDVRFSEYATVRNARLDGVALGQYLCTAELGGEGPRLCGMAPVCHEYAHILGLPDFYDTDGTLNGLCGGLYDFSLMSDSIFSQDIPPALNAEERLMLGWMRTDQLLDLPQEGPFTLGPVRENKACRYDASTEGEYFLCEYRDGKSWDAAIPRGLYVYHVDKSERIVWQQDVTAARLWRDWMEFNSLNANGLHPCCYLIPSSDPAALLVRDAGAIPFPGPGHILSCDPLDWENQYTDVQLTQITLTEAGAQLYVLRGQDANVNGRVTRRDGSPVSGASVSVQDLPEVGSAVTGPDGQFFLPLPEGLRDGRYLLDVSRTGFRRQQYPVLQTGRSASAVIKLTAVQEPDSISLVKYDPLAERIYFPLPSPDFGDCMGAVRFTPEELFPHVGRRLTHIAFSPYLPEGYDRADALYLIVDFGRSRMLTRKLDRVLQGPFLFNEVDISDADLRIPEDIEVYVGYAYEGASYPYMLGATLNGHEGNSFYAPFNLEQSDWRPLYSDKSGAGQMDLLASVRVAEVEQAASLSEMGYTAIDPGKGHWRAGESFPLVLLQAGGPEPEVISWSLDGTPVSGSSVPLTAGTHKVQADVYYQGGRNEVLRMVLSVD